VIDERADGNHSAPLGKSQVIIVKAPDVKEPADIRKKADPAHYQRNIAGFFPVPDAMDLMDCSQ